MKFRLEELNSIFLKIYKKSEAGKPATGGQGGVTTASPIIDAFSEIRVLRHQNYFCFQIPDSPRQGRDSQE